jgi:hypothetical protein
MMVTKFSKKHVHILNTLNKKLQFIFGDNFPPFNFRSLNPLHVHHHNRTVVVKFNDNLFVAELLKDMNLDKLSGKAICRESDVFVLRTGVKIARTKLFKALMIQMQKQASEQMIKCEKAMRSFNRLYHEKMDESNLYMNQLSSESVE